MIPLDLRTHVNAYAATYDRDRTRGTVNAWGNSFPAEELPFGGTLLLDGLRFDLPPKVEGAFDHCEALGQRLALPRPAHGLGLLAFGEMGPQSMDLAIEFTDGSIGLQRVRANGWLVEGDPAPNTDRLLCTHLHYVGGYELSLLRPALWSVRVCWERGDAVRLRLGENPLFHIVALTALTEHRDG
jgi:hypothetical protein